jgi:hypothetical protein
MSEVGLPETDADVESDDEVDGCELDFSVEPTPDDGIAAFLAAPAASPKEKSEEEWEQEAEEEN